MSDFFEKQPDPLEGLLAPPPTSPDASPDAALRERTVRLLRRRRRLRRLAWCAALAACYVLGMLSMRWLTPPPVPAPAPPAIAEQHTDPPPPALQLVPRPEPQPEARTAVAREWQALDSGNRAEERKLNRQAGDLYLEEEDLASAARCYGRELSAGTREDLTISPEDNWLLMAIKSARQKENSDANKGS